MEKYYFKSKLSNEKGVTLVALVITIVLLGIILSIAIDTSTTSLDNVKLKRFYTQLELVQKRVDDIITTNESYVNNSGQIVYLKNVGVALTSTQTASLQTILSKEGVGLSASTFKYFTKEQLETILDLRDIDYNVFVNFDTRTVVAENGIKIGDKTYYVLKNNIFYTSGNSINNASINFSYSIFKLGTNNYKILVIPSETNAGAVLKYKKNTSKYWETSNNFEILINELTQYNILYEDNIGNSIYQTINVYLENGIPKVNIYNYS